MRVVQIVQKFAPGGLESVAASLQRRWGACVATISLEGEARSLLRDWSAMADMDGSLIALGKRPGIDLACVGALAAALRRLKPDAVVTHHIGPMIYGAIAARLSGVRVRAHVEHDAWHLDSPGRMRLFSAALTIGAPRLAAVSDYLADSLTRRTGKRVARVVNGVDLERFKPGDRALARAQLGLPAQGFVIGVAARLQKVKGVDVLIDALALMRTPAVLAIMGDGPERAALERQAHAAGLTERVVFLGLRGDVETVIPALDAFVLPSRAEGLPLALVEAQASGAPVVACDVGGTREACCPRTARLVAPENPRALADAIDERLQSPLEASPRDFARTFSLIAMIDAYEKLTGVDL
jgi:glycosyltransferase involved in cell wall biosynthesis